ncbi:hypothetical protein BD309DRAFT_955629 [Dichomitus squalens]|nr:hypothetical protein BD309DRAFT_955629 [Dichomitus squalens]
MLKAPMATSRIEHLHRLRVSTKWPTSGDGRLQGQRSTPSACSGPWLSPETPQTGSEAYHLTSVRR